MISYRADFWIQFIGGLAVSVFVAYFLWKAIYASTATTLIGGLTFDEMMLYYVLAPLVDRCVKGNEYGSLSPDIYDGSFTRYLIFPISPLLYKYASHLAVSAIGFFQFALGLTICLFFFKAPASAHFTFAHFVMGYVTMLLAGVLYFLMSSCLEFVAFWADNVWSLLVMLRFTGSLLGGSLLPLSLFPSWSQKLIHFLPFAYLTSFPIQVLMGHVGVNLWLEGIVAIVCWSFFFLLLNRVTMKRGLYHYTGVGI